MNTGLKVLIWIIIIIIALITIFNWLLKKYFQAFVTTVKAMYTVSDLRSNPTQEGYATAQTYDNGIMPFHLSRAAVDMYTGPMNQFCQPIVNALCKDNPTIACVTQTMKDCAAKNSQQITNMCAATVPYTLCSADCEGDLTSIKCQACQGLAQMQNICKRPDFQN
jgi:hypothetical protein